MRFDNLNLPECLLHAVEDLGFVTPTPIQAQGLPHLLQGRDLAGQAQTGTGKTACFLLAAMTRLLETKRPEGGRPRTLVVAPTRELAIQIAGDAENLAVHTDLEVGLCYGGTAWNQQAQVLKDGVDIVVGTPGRLIDYVRNGVLRLDAIEVFVLDEADRMFDMGFIQDINYLFRQIPPKTRRQAMLFSATLNERVMRLAWRYMSDPVEIAIEPESLVVEEIEQELYHVGSDEKVALLLGLLERENPARAMVFVNTKRMGEELTWRLNQNGRAAAYMSGDIPQRKRQKILSAFREGEITLLVATDVASRGIHVDDVTHVFNYDVPQDPEDYVHRIGRTARAGAKGRAITLACEQFVIGLPSVETLIDRKIPSHVPDEGVLGEDRAGRFYRKRGRTYIGWPPDDREDARAGEAGHGDDDDRGGRRRSGRGRRDEGRPAASSGGRSRRGGRGSRSDREARPERTPVAEPTPAPRPEPRPAAEASGGGSSRRQRRRIGEGPQLTTPTALAD